MALALAWESDRIGGYRVYLGRLTLYVSPPRHGGSSWAWSVVGGLGGVTPTREAAQRAAEDAARRLLREWLSQLEGLTDG